MIEVVETQLLQDPTNVQLQKQLIYLSDPLLCAQFLNKHSEKDSGFAHNENQPVFQKKPQIHYDLSAGYDSNPLDLTSSDFVTISFPEVSIELPLESKAQGSWGTKALATKEFKSTIGSTEVFLNSEVYKHLGESNHSLGLIFTPEQFVQPEQRASSASQTNAFKLLASLNNYRGLKVGMLGVRYQHPFSPKSLLSYDAQLKLYRHNADYDSLYQRLSWRQRIGKSDQSIYDLHFAYHNEIPKPENNYPGGGTQGVQFGFHYSGQFWEKPIQLQTIMDYQKDQRGYSEFFENNARRHIRSLNLTGRWWLKTPTAKKNGYYVEFEWRNRKSNINLFNSNGLSIFFGTAY